MFVSVLPFKSIVMFLSAAISMLSVTSDKISIVSLAFAAATALASVAYSVSPIFAAFPLVLSSANAGIAIVPSTIAADNTPASNFFKLIIMFVFPFLDINCV